MKTFISLLLLCSTCTLFSQNVSINLVSNDFTIPLGLEHAGDDRMFVVEKGGKIKIMHQDGSVNATPFLDLSGQVSSGAEQGLLGLAFHPDYENNGYFYVNYTKMNWDTRIARFEVDPTNPDIALVSSEEVILEYEQPFDTHNGGDIMFGPDGYLYISSGDGGSGGDPGNRAQNTELLLGKLLRIDVDGGSPYSIPSDNPFAGSSTDAEEIWAYGLRNPWRFTIDEESSTIWIADVGQSEVEEINKANISEAGLNYGWRCYEGSEPYNTEDCPSMDDLTFPIVEYPSSEGNCAVTGGHVYRGSFPNIQGLYFFADLCSDVISTIDAEGNREDHGVFDEGSWVAFGEDVNNELYVLNYSGGVYRIEGSLSVSDNSFEKFAMFPNPASNKVTFSYENSVIDGIRITDIKGTVVFKSEGVMQGETSISTTTLPSGMYLVSLSNTMGSTSTQKLIVE